MNLLYVFLQAAAPDAAPSGGGNAQIMQIVFLVGIVAVFYFLIIRPQQKKAKKI